MEKECGQVSPLSFGRLFSHMRYNVIENKVERGIFMNGFLTVKEVADKWGMTVRNVQNLCAAGKIEGVAKFGNAWAIPEDAEKPQDMRVISGVYKNWRKKSQ